MFILSPNHRTATAPLLTHPGLHEVLSVVQVLRERALEVAHDSVPLEQEEVLGDFVHEEPAEGMARCVVVRRSNGGVKCVQRPVVYCSTPKGWYTVELIQ